MTYLDGPLQGKTFSLFEGLKFSGESDADVSIKELKTGHYLIEINTEGLLILSAQDSAPPIFMAGEEKNSLTLMPGLIFGLGSTTFAVQEAEVEVEVEIESRGRGGRGRSRGRSRSRGKGAGVKTETETETEIEANTKTDIKTEIETKIDVDVAADVAADKTLSNAPSTQNKKKEASKLFSSKSFLELSYALIESSKSVSSPNTTNAPDTDTRWNRHNRCAGYDKRAGYNRCS